MVFPKYFCGTLDHSKSNFCFGAKCSFIKKYGLSIIILKRKRLNQTPELNYGVVVKKSTPSLFHRPCVPVQVKGKTAERSWCSYYVNVALQK